MKKHLHGKRHTIARRSVRLGRYRKRQRRIEKQWTRLMRVCARVNDEIFISLKQWHQVMERFAAAMAVPARFLTGDRRPAWRVKRDDQDKN